MFKDSVQSHHASHYLTLTFYEHLEGSLQIVKFIITLDA